jgi:hypothetical protein
MLYVIGRDAIDLLLPELRLRSRGRDTPHTRDPRDLEDPIVILSTLIEEPARGMGLDLSADDLT